VRVSGRGVGVTLLSVDVKKEFVTKTTLAALETLKERQRAIEAQMQTLTDEHTTLDAHYEFVRLLSQRSGERLAVSLTQAKMTIEQANDLSAYLFSLIQQRYQRQSAINAQLVELQHTLNALKQQIATAGQSKNTQLYQVRIAVRVTHEIEAEFDIDYLVQGASWQPFYDVRLLPDQRLELTYFADVTQRSGEDWQNVNLALSTARPAKTATLPELHQQYVDTRATQAQHVKRFAPPQPENNRKQAEQAPAGGEAIPDFDQLTPEQTIQWMESLARRAPTTEEDRRRQEYVPYGWKEEDWRKLQQEGATVNQAGSGGALTYLIRTPTDIPSDGTPHKTTVAVLTMNAKLDYLTIPKITPEVYLRATITNTSEYTLLPGAMSIFHGEDFIGKTQLALIAANEDFKVQLGIEERLKVERKLVKREASKRFIGNKRLLSYRYQLTVTNLLLTSAKISLSDQIPIARDETVKILNVLYTPEPSEKTDLGILTWTFDLAANAVQTLHLEFTVEYARDSDLLGLEQ
jgi:hypothetical protein